MSAPSVEAPAVEQIPLLGKAIEIADGRGMKTVEGLDWGLRAVHEDFTSSHGFRWAFPGQWSEASGPFTTSGDPCPSTEGDGLCVGLSWAGMASGRIPARTVLLVGWKPSDVLAIAAEKVRVKRAFVRDALIIRDILNGGTGADLHGANLRSADLRSADLRGADLRGANLRGADLCSADLRGANLRGADLCSADLLGADLRSANLRSADLRSADLLGANLRGADLRVADLLGANLHGANLPINFVVPSGAVR